MDYKGILELVKTMSSSNLSHLEIEGEGIKIKMEKEPLKGEAVIVEKKLLKDDINFTEDKKEDDDNLIIIKSPIVGTFYGSSSPEDEPFIKIGSKVKKGDVLCIIEAMKLMNEIESEYDGEVVEVLVKNEDMVEYDQPLFKIKTI